MWGNRRAQEAAAAESRSLAEDSDYWRRHLYTYGRSMSAVEYCEIQTHIGENTQRLEQLQRGAS